MQNPTYVTTISNKLTNQDQIHPHEYTHLMTPLSAAILGMQILKTYLFFINSPYEYIYIY